MDADPRHGRHGERVNRRDFIAMLTAASAALKSPLSIAQGISETPRDQSSLGHADHSAIGFPRSDYTPFGYLDNPWHSWNLHQSGVLSLPGIGFGLYYPAGPGGYFDYARNGIYVAELALGFRIGERTFRAFESFQPKQLTSPYHSKNIPDFEIERGISLSRSAFLKSMKMHLLPISRSSRQPAQRRRSRSWRHTYRLGGSQWWGADGLAGGYQKETDNLWIRSFAAGNCLRSLFKPSEQP